MKSRISSEPSSRSQMLYWINRTLGTQQTRIENLGNGIVYCKLIHHFEPSVLPLNKVNLMARAPHEFHSNLRKFQDALNILGIKDANFDVYKVAELGYQQNWQLISHLYRALNEREKRKTEISWQQQLKSSIGFPQNHSFNSQAFSALQNAQQLNISKFESVKTPLRLLKETDRIQGNKNMPFFSNAIVMVQRIKKIVQEDQRSDRNKVKILKSLLGIELNDKDQYEMNEFFSDEKKKECIVID